MELFQKLTQRKLLLVTGKGGIGKSFLSASIGQWLADSGLKVCLVEAVSQEQLSLNFGLKESGHYLTQITPNLFGINLNSDDNFKDFIVKHLGLHKLFNKVFRKPIVKSLVKLIPGIVEMTLLGRLYYFCEIHKDPEFDIVIFDGFSTGHFFSLLQTPDAIINSGMVGPVITETIKVRDYLLTPKVGIILATLGEDLAVDECLELAEKLKEPGFPNLDMILINKKPNSLPEEALDSGLEEHEKAAFIQCWQRLSADHDRFHHAYQSLANKIQLLYQNQHDAPMLVLAKDLGLAYPGDKSASQIAQWFHIDPLQDHIS